MVHSDATSDTTPAPLGRRERKRQARVNEILTMGMTLLAEGGLDALTIHALAKRLDVAVGALYRYFPSKGALIGALERRVVAELKEELGISVQAAELHWGDVQEPWARLAPIVALARAFRERTESRPERMGLIGRIMAEPHHMLPREEGERVIADAVGLLKVLRVPFDRASAAGVLRHGDELLRPLLFWAGLRSVLQTFKLETFAPSVIQPDALYEGMVQSLLGGWGASLEDIARAQVEVSAWHQGEEI